MGKAFATNGLFNGGRLNSRALVNLESADDPSYYAGYATPYFLVFTCNRYHVKWCASVNDWHRSL
ncbi:hypothetical protein CRENPOLYSF1_430016 [Crenothrix polyspora]|uniref:Uncharacterized protein n=1 Tax=Crenothrix polyspora TaxID=360316 RepID=A0A1R4HAM3_9GAMM|nr:hypothetical protein CRENPOLYSF1_430016 [Crenothrix polyspora]